MRARTLRPCKYSQGHNCLLFLAGVKILASGAVILAALRCRLGNLAGTGLLLFAMRGSSCQKTAHVWVLANQPLQFLFACPWIILKSYIQSVDLPLAPDAGSLARTATCNLGVPVMRQVTELTIVTVIAAIPIN